LSGTARVSRYQKGIRSSAIGEGPRDASCQLISCQLPRNSAEATRTTSPEQIEVMQLEGYSGAMCSKHVHSTMTRWSRFHCPIGVINKPTTGELWISPVYRRLAVAHTLTHPFNGPLSGTTRMRRYQKRYKTHRRGTARCVESIEILPIATQQCRNYLYDKS